MSGIAGFLYLDGRKADAGAIDRMTDTMSHRGPDRRGVWREGPVAFGHQALWTTPEASSENFPQTAPRSGLVLTADARIDNRSEMIRELGPFDSHLVTDADLILSAYRRWGMDCPKKLIGDFAFAIWDRGKNEIFCARDAFGVRPFYYFRSERIFAFASEIKAILELPEVPRRLNDIAVGDYLLWSSEDKQITFYRDIFRLPPAHRWTVSHRRSEPDRYWRLDPARELRLGSEAEYAERFRDIFFESVRCRTRSSHPVGSLLSGGLDTSSIVSTARLLPLPGGKIHTFSAIFDDVPECDERLYIKEVAGLPRVEPHFIRADRLPQFMDLENIYRFIDGAHCYNLSMFWSGIYPEARQSGVRVLMDGDGGDETVSRGYPRLCELLAAGRWTELNASLVRLSENTGKPVSELLWLRTLRPFLPVWLHGLWRAVRWQGRPLWMDDTVIREDFVKKAGLARRAKSQLRYEVSMPRNVRLDDLVGLESGALTAGLEVPNHAAAAFGLEPRYPFFDRRLAEYCLSLPSNQKLRRGWTKWVMRNALGGVLPEAIRWRGSKTYLDRNISHGLLKFEREEVDELVRRDTARLAPYVDLGKLASAHEAFLKEAAYEPTTSVWQACLLSVWLRTSALES